MRALSIKVVSGTIMGMPGNSLKESITPSGEFKAVISQRDDGMIEVTTYKWTHEFAPDYGEVCDPFWEKLNGPSFVDTLETGFAVATEQLRNCSGEPLY
jgi:hypothetical protein